MHITRGTRRLAGRARRSIGAMSAAVLAASLLVTVGAPAPPAGAVGGSNRWREYTDIRDVAGAVLGPDGAMWVTNPSLATIGRVATNGSVTSYRNELLYSPGQIVNGPDKTMWFVNRSSIATVTRMTTSGAMTFVSGITSPTSIAYAPGGPIWVGGVYSVYKIDPATLSVTKYTQTGGVTAVAVGPDGNLWYTTGNATIGRLRFPGGVPTVDTWTGTDVNQPMGITVAAGALWFANRGNSTIGRISTAGALSSYPEAAGALPYLNPAAITTGPDGAVWFSAGSTVSRMDTATHAVTSRPTSVAGRPTCTTPSTIASGAGSSIWYGCSGRVLGHVPMTSGNPVTQIGLDTPQSLVVGPDGNTWYVNGAGSIGKVTPTGAITNYYDVRLVHPWSIVTRGTSLWFTDYGARAIGRITTAGTVTMYPLPGVPGNYPGPYDLANGPDGRLWFTAGNEIGKFDTGTQDVTRFPVTGSFGGIAASPSDHALWVTNQTTKSLQRITTAGAVTDSVTAPWITGPGGITQGLDNHSIWFTAGAWTTLGSIDTVTRKATEHTNAALGAAQSIAAGPDGAVWTNSHVVDGTVYRMRPTNDAQGLTPSWSRRALETGDLVTGSDGAMWLRWGAYGAIARVTTKVTPQIDGLSPSTGTVGSVVAIHGINLTGATAVAFNGVPATFGVWDDTDIVAIVPAGATKGRVTVTTPIGTAWGPTFTPSP
jgi:virginiamycin B lyase